MLVKKLYYTVKPLIPRKIQLELRGRAVLNKRKSCSNKWPIEIGSQKTPEGWKSWPDSKKFALVLTHDVDTAFGQKKCIRLKELEEALEFRSSFNFVPERYKVESNLRKQLASAGFEIGVHGLNHDGKLYNSKKIFKERANKINKYMKEWNAVGFRSPAMHHNLEWLHALNIEYDASTFDTDPFEPQSDGVGTIFPFWVSEDAHNEGYVELPYTLPQDFTLFILMREKTIDIWKKKLDWIAEHGGMALVNTHPDYMNFGGGKPRFEEYPVEYYEELLEYIKNKYEGLYWHVLPKEMARFWKNNT